MSHAPRGIPGADAGCWNRGGTVSTGLSTDPWTVRRFVENCPPGSDEGGRTSRSGGPWAGSNRAAERPPNDVDDLLDVAIRVALLGGGADAALDVVLQDQDRQ